MIASVTPTWLCDVNGRRQHGSRLRVLVIDDVCDAADSLRMLLELYGHDVQVAYTGPRAIELAGLFRPEVVLCDIRMPDVCGYDVAQALRDNPATAGARLIAITGFTSEAVRQRCRAAGFEHHLVKPIDVEQLRDLLAVFADESRERQIAEHPAVMTHAG